MKTVKIKPYTAFFHGKKATATQLSVISREDNLFDYVLFEYTLLDEANQWVGASTFTLSTLEEYQTWLATPECAFEIVAAAVGLELVSNDKEVMFIEVS